MITALKYGSVLLAWLWVMTDSVQAQSRVGAPFSSNASGSGGGASAKTAGPNLLPTQNYAVIDLGEPPAPAPPMHGEPDPDFAPAVAMDDDHNVGILYNYAFDTYSDCYAVVQTFHNGVLSPRTTYQAVVSNPSVYDFYAFGGVRPNGDLWVQHTHEPLVPTDPRPPGYTLNGIFANGSSVDFGLPTPYLGEKPYLHAEGSSFSANNCFYGGGYTQVPGPDGKPVNYGGGYGTMFSGSQQIVFDPAPPASAVDSAAIRYIRSNFAALDLNDTGSGLNGSRMWDGVHKMLIPTGVPDSATAFCLNNQNWFLIRADNTEGTLWHAGTVQKFTDFLAGGAWAGQLKQVRPQVLSNQNTTDGSMYAITSLQDSGSHEQVVWKATSPNFTGAGLAGALKWQPYKMKFPDGVTIKDYSFEVVSSSGVIAAIGNSGKGDNHALLLVPIGLRLLNGFTTDFDGQIIKKIIQAPENPHYLDDVGQQPSMDSDGNYHKDDTLGAKSPGGGRRTENCVAYDTLVAAQAPLLPWLHYKWKRAVFEYDWLILKKDNPTHWEVLCRNVNSNQSDENDSFSNDTPSEKRKEFYNYDDSGIHFDPSINNEHPEYVFDSRLNVNDFRYCEKVFSYLVMYSIYVGGTPPEDVQWIDGVEMFCSQKVLVQEIKKSNLIQKVWKVKSHTFVEGKTSPRISIDKVRQIVGGNLPITLLPDATYHNQVDPPDTNQVDTSN